MNAEFAQAINNLNALYNTGAINKATLNLLLSGLVTAPVAAPAVVTPVAAPPVVAPVIDPVITRRALKSNKTLVKSKLRKKLDKIRKSASKRAISSKKEKVLKVVTRQHRIGLAEVNKEFLKFEKRLALTKFVLIEEAFRANTRSYRLNALRSNRGDFFLFLDEARKLIERKLQSDFETQQSPLKYTLAVKCTYLNMGLEDWKFFQSATQIILTVDDIPDAVGKSIDHLIFSFGMISATGGPSSLAFKEVNYLDLHSSNYQPIRGAGWMPTPASVAKSKSCVNPVNTIQGSTTIFDEKCFMWCILAALYPAKAQPARISNYRAHADELNFTGINFPVVCSKRTMSVFEKNNPHVSLTVFAHEERGGFIPLYVDGINHSSVALGTATQVDLLLIDSGDVRRGAGHYLLIRNLSALIGKELNNTNSKQLICRRCLYHTRDPKLFKFHDEDCRGICGEQSVGAVARMPNPAKGETTIIKFKSIEKKMKAPFVVYADFETMNVPIDKHCGKGSHHTSEHQICSAAFTLIGPDGAARCTEMHRGKDSALWLINTLKKRHYEIIDEIKAGQNPPVLTASEELDFSTATCCHICKGAFEHQHDAADQSSQPVRDHDHLTNVYRGAAHSACNLQWRLNPKTYKLPIFFHNLKGYDSHFLIRAFAECEGRMNIVPQNYEKYLAFSLGGLSFKDSFAFMPSSLEGLAKNLGGNTPLTKRAISSYSETAQKLLLQKGVFPYKWFDGEDKFESTSLPDKVDFNNDLTGEDISDKDYARAQAVWKETNCVKFEDYHNVYLLTDVSLLADVFETFRTLMMEKHGVDPAHYLTTPGMSWDAMLQLTGVELELMTEMDMQLFVEKGIRGGITQVSHRCAVANNPEAEASGGPEYDSSKQRTYLAYQDMNNLYGIAMKDYLPTGGFKWIEPQSVSNELLALAARADDGARGAFYEVDLHYPVELHDLHNDYPLAAEQGIITGADLSPWAAMQLGADDALKHTSKKLLLTLNDKHKYVLHYRNLKEYLRHGLKLTCVHRILEFDQSTWMKPWIDKNTDLRRTATNDFEKDFYKLLNNACFGKSMEQVRNRVDITLLRDSEKCPEDRNRYRKMVSKPNFESRRIFTCESGEEAQIVAVQRYRTNVVLNKPIYVGLTVLDLSKLHMVNYLYDELIPRYGAGNVKTLYTDTDSFVFEFKTENLEADMLQAGHLYDTSNYKKGPLQELAKANPLKEKKLGLMKDEFGGRSIHRVVFLKSKVYVIEGENEVVKKSKGTQRAVVKNLITADCYWGIVKGGKELRHTNVGFRTNNHIVTTCRVNKKSLSAFDDKRWILDDGISSYAYGHYKISLLKQ